MKEEISIRAAEEKAIKEAEFIAASESIKLAQELSLRLKTSEPTSIASSRCPSLSAFEEKNDNEKQFADQPERIDEKNRDEVENLLENENESREEEKIDEEQDQVAEEDEKNEKTLSQEEVTSQISNNTQEPIIEIKEENDNAAQPKKQESKLILNEFRHDSVSFKEEQQETNGHSENAEITILQESENQDLENIENYNDEAFFNHQEPLEIHGCGHKLHEFSESTKYGITGIFDSCKNNTNSMNTQLKKSAWEYFDSLHSRLINLAGFHSPDECSICKDFKHQDVPLLN
ncbi:uncharacterized protein ELE39_002258 [Cryptosporidium sp. chipmunk genotype I]|uniref:uncharacterized protein n=1 Tax=Cryptosporidium sp. chipmunk genotype I TaxID=1280935 RepID=UPI00351A63F4|nr:hypothetical protein ELE39_002258 [Cryptosporidium sp. chipmunk genotype I]